MSQLRFVRRQSHLRFVSRQSHRRFLSRQSCPRFVNRQLCLRLLSRHSHLRFAPRQSSLVSTSPVRVSPVVSETASIDKEISKLVQATKNWFRIKLQIMIDFTELKFEQCQQFQKYLLGTQNRKLIHNVQDKY
jgi:hypothetical protein